MMIIRLHTLSARAPSMQDAYKVVELMHMSDKDTHLLGDYHEDDIKLAWQQAGFHLMLDAWVIVTRDDQFVGYADVQQTCEQASKNFILALYIHPDYQSRGIETLLIRLGEERIHQISRSISTYYAIKVSISVSQSNHLLREAVQYEGYTLVQQFLRMHIALEQMTHQSLAVSDGLMTLDVPLSTVGGKSTRTESKKVGAYTAKLYDVYEKMLEYGLIDKKKRENVPALQDTTV
jgi:ribosomal protein S18 acetylase RimI-like enzyme